VRLERADEEMRPFEQLESGLANIDTLSLADVDRFVMQYPVEVKIQE